MNIYSRELAVDSLKPLLLTCTGWLYQLRTASVGPPGKALFRVDGRSQYL